MRIKSPPEPSSQEVNLWLDKLFSPVILGRETDDYIDAITAFENLTGFFISTAFAKKPGLKCKALDGVRIDAIGLVSMLRRFQRDAFGAHNFFLFAESLHRKGSVSAETLDELFRSVRGLGLRISAEFPSRIRIAAAFSVWMCVFRPVTFDPERLQRNVPPMDLEMLCASLNFFLASSYLSKFGQINLGPPESHLVDRIKIDFTTRDVSLLSLETLYRAVFSPQS